MGKDAMPVLWLYGPPGVGKSTVGWELFTRLTADGTPAGYVDIDQLGVCYGPPQPDDWVSEPVDDQGRHRMKARNLDAVAANQRAAGARIVIVSGVVDPQRGVDRGLLPRAAVRTLRLRADLSELRRRLTGRGRSGDDIDKELAHADELDRVQAADECVDTTRLPASAVVDLVSARLNGWTTAPAALHRRAVQPAADHASGAVVWVCGVTAIGKSTVGWQLYQRIRASGFHTALVDLEQLGFHQPTPPDDPRNDRLKAANLAALWRTYHAAGAQRLVLIGDVDSNATKRAYAAALPATTLTVCRLHAGRETIHQRILQRGKGIRPADLAGDQLIGQPAETLQAAADRAAARAEALDRAGVGDLRIDTDGRDVDDLVDEILRDSHLDEH
jgi:gluconate kinase